MYEAQKDEIYNEYMGDKCRMKQEYATEVGENCIN